MESSCETVYIAPLASVGGTLQNITLTGEIRVTGPINVKARSVFGFALGNTVVQDVYSNVRFTLNGVKQMVMTTTWFEDITIATNRTSSYLGSLN